MIRSARLYSPSSFEGSTLQHDSSIPWPPCTFGCRIGTAPGVDWLYQFTNNLTNLTTQNGDALASVGMALLAFISLIKLVRMVAQWNIATMTISLSAQPVRIGDLVEFLMQLILCLLILNYWVTPFPGASFGFNHLFSYCAQVIVAAPGSELAQSQLAEARTQGTALNSTPQPSYLAPMEILTYLLVYLVVGLASRHFLLPRQLLIVHLLRSGCPLPVLISLFPCS